MNIKSNKFKSKKYIQSKYLHSQFNTPRTYERLNCSELLLLFKSNGSAGICRQI